MNKTQIKRLIALLLCMLLVVGSFPAYAASIPDKYNDPKYVVDGRVDYKNLYTIYFQSLPGNDNLAPPTASFKVAVKRGGTLVATGISDSGDILYARVGDTLTISNTSSVGSGKGLAKCDFQVSDGTSIKYATTSLGGINLSAISMDTEGTYNIYLNVMDNSTLNTEGWGNWAYNGTHRSPGTNPGGGTGSDFPGWWYYAKLTVVVKAPEYTLEEKHIDTISGAVLHEVIHEGIKENSKTTHSQSFDGYKFIGSRAGYTWNDIANGITQSISSRTANFNPSQRVAFHYYYYEKVTPPPTPPEGRATIYVYYKDKVSGAAVHPADYTTYADVKYGTYVIEALPDTDMYTLDTASTPSPQTVTVNVANRFKEVTFLYTPKSTPALRGPVAILTGPEQVMAGEDFVVSAEQSYARDGARIIAYNWDINRYTPTYPFDSSDKKITLWSDIAEGDYCSVEVTVVDNNGLTDTDRIGIEVLPAIPTPVITITGELKENRKVTLSALNSKSPRHFPIDHSKTRWEITAVSGGSDSDIKYIGQLEGVAVKDTLYKKAGIYHVKLYVENIAGLSAIAETDIIIKPDLVPVASFSTPTTILRDPSNGNYGTFTLTNLSYSEDGDPIWKSAALVVYDSNNNGSYDEETCYYSVNGTTWVSTGKNYAQIKSQGFDIFNLSSTNPGTFTYKSTQVGKYLFELFVIEGIPVDKTIIDFITPSDYKRNNTIE